MSQQLDQHYQAIEQMIHGYVQSLESTQRMSDEDLQLFKDTMIDSLVPIHRARQAITDMNEDKSRHRSI